jgi:hypothetical protein
VSGTPFPEDPAQWIPPALLSPRFPHCSRPGCVQQPTMIVSDLVYGEPEPGNVAAVCEEDLGWWALARVQLHRGKSTTLAVTPVQRKGA